MWQRRRPPRRRPPLLIRFEYHIRCLRYESTSFQELFELTQRKFLRLAISFAETMSTRAYPRLFALDYRADGEESAQTRARIEAIAQLTKEQPQQEQTSAENDKRDLGAEQRRDEEVRQQEQEAAKTVTATRVETSDVRSRMQKIPNALCVRVLCENEENWHTAGYPFEINERVVVMNSASYLSRMMLLLKHSDLPLEILTTDEGEKELQRIADVRIETRCVVVSRSTALPLLFTHSSRNRRTPK